MYLIFLLLYMCFYEWNLYLFSGDMDGVLATPAATATARPNCVFCD